MNAVPGCEDVGPALTYCVERIRTETVYSHAPVLSPRQMCHFEISVHKQETGNIFTDSVALIIRLPVCVYMELSCLWGIVCKLHYCVELNNAQSYIADFNKKTYENIYNESPRYHEY